MAPLAALVVGRELGCDDELVADTTLLSQLADEGLGSLILAVVNKYLCKPLRWMVSSLIFRRIDEVTLEMGESDHIRGESTSGRITHACVEIVIEQLEGTRLVHGSHSECMPLVANVHSTELQG